MTLTTERGRVKIIVNSTLGSLLTVTCKHPSGRIRTVRGMEFASLSSGQFIGWDYEMPVGLSVEYTASVYADVDTLVAQSLPGTVTWVTAADWLKDPLQPSRNMAVQMQQPQSFTYQTPSGVHLVINRPDPLVVTAVREASASTISFYTETKDERDRFHFLTASGNVLLLQSTQESGIGNLYLAPLQVEESPISTRDDPGRIWTVQYQEVGYPGGDPAAFNTWQDVIDMFPGGNWSDLIGQYPTTWLQFISEFNAAPQNITTWRGA